jgi:hypothetical protein
MYTYIYRYTNKNIVAVFKAQDRKKKFTTLPISFSNFKGRKVICEMVINNDYDPNRKRERERERERERDY